METQAVYKAGDDLPQFTFGQRVICPDGDGVILGRSENPPGWLVCVRIDAKFPNKIYPAESVVPVVVR